MILKPFLPLGKTAMLMSFSQNVFPNESVPTVYDNFVTTIVVNGKPIRLGMWDTAGQEDMARLRMVSYPMTVIRIHAFCFQSNVYVYEQRFLRLINFLKRLSNKTSPHLLCGEI